jgi:Nitrile hydratase, alpha chain
VPPGPTRQDLAAREGICQPQEAQTRGIEVAAIVRYLVLPKRPEGTENFTEEELAGLVTRDTMIGVVEPKLETRRAAQ